MSTNYYMGSTFLIKDSKIELLAEIFDTLNGIFIKGPIILSYSMLRNDYP